MPPEIGTAPVGARRLRLGMIGGGQGAYIGGIHRFAARLDGEYDLVAGAFDVDAARGHAFAASNHIVPERSYDDYRAMIEAERRRPDCIDVVAICTPNHTHFPIAKAFLEAGFDVICEKPLTTTLEDAAALVEIADAAGRFLGVTYTYCGYPMVHEARTMVQAGAIGVVRVVQVEYPLEWMATAIEQQGNEQAAWRTDPKRSGRGGRAGRFRSPGDGQVDFKAIFSKLTGYGFDGWAVLEWECCLKNSEDGAAEGARFIRDHIIEVSTHAFDDFVKSGADRELNRIMIGAEAAR